MQSSLLRTIQQLPTPTLQERFYEEWDRVANVLMRVYPFPFTNEVLKVMLEELMALNEELERRKEPFHR